MSILAWARAVVIIDKAVTFRKLAARFELARNLYGFPAMAAVVRRLSFENRVGDYLFVPAFRANDL